LERESFSFGVSLIFFDVELPGLYLVIGQSFFVCPSIACVFIIQFPHSLDMKEDGGNRECNTYKDSDEYDYALRRLKFFGIRFQKLR